MALCNNAGSLGEDGQCSCPRLFSGEHCENTGEMKDIKRLHISCFSLDECWDDSDCGEHGKCHEYGSDTYPQKVCYCELGYYGPKCALGERSLLPYALQYTLSASAITSKADFDPAKYSVQTLGKDDDRVYWRVLEETNELEVVMQVI